MSSGNVVVTPRMRGGLVTECRQALRSLRRIQMRPRRGRRHTKCILGEDADNNSPSLAQRAGHMQRAGSVKLVMEIVHFTQQTDVGLDTPITLDCQPTILLAKYLGARYGEGILSFYSRQ
jgi:hypothetical protein